MLWSLTPGKGKPLSPAQIEVLKRWVAGGARWTQHWAFSNPNRQCHGCLSSSDTALPLSGCPRRGRKRPGPARCARRHRASLAGKKQAAAVIRSPWMMTAPSCSAPPGWKIAHNRSRETCASRLTPLSTKVLRPILRSRTIRAPILFCDKRLTASTTSWLSSRRSIWLTPKKGRRPSRASALRSSA